MIIVEGPDNTGKTTLIQQLQDIFHLPSLRAGFHPQNPKDIHQYHYWAVTSPRQLILDRHPAVSDFIYTPILRPTEPELSSLDLIIRMLDRHYTIFALPPFNQVEKSYDERPQLKGTKENLRRIYQAYEKLLNDFEPNFLYDYTKPNAFTALTTHLTHYLARSS